MTLLPFSYSSNYGLPCFQTSPCEATDLLIFFPEVSILRQYRELGLLPPTSATDSNLRLIDYISFSSTLGILNVVDFLAYVIECIVILFNYYLISGRINLTKSATRSNAKFEVSLNRRQLLHCFRSAINISFYKNRWVKNDHKNLRRSIREILTVNTVYCGPLVKSLSANITTAIRPTCSPAKDGNEQGSAWIFVLSQNHSSRTPAQEEEGQQNKKRLLVIALITIPMIMILLRTMMYFLKRRVVKSIGIIDNIKRSVYRLLNVIPATVSFNINAPNLSTSWRGWFIYVYKEG
ncbi:uncharacterized protein LOC133735600 isoform X1 [Rosa rugosa]|uniref:uncharacterized protein LOC133735600 isoform X1 n=1 Tax=Rosa rugosa TaxID=74645 RepID=UPI002B40C972|nr:uncharacterized protein LOC133735600 isoform X1 [Rosa rugosa]XP_062018987.1 uncharacterized protein LOC133735600 isoform X1 [Rosa rugosa]XP_062018988.1 uncharacterized protein LOC133735600 isoform X1 [Rosa rugosa]XP_062018989.1 uncharacterized protein LOC133735600 isoform X1 [Rosa rugosa]